MIATPFDEPHVDALHDEVGAIVAASRGQAAVAVCLPTHRICAVNDDVRNLAATFGVEVAIGADPTTVYADSWWTWFRDHVDDLVRSGVPSWAEHTDVVLRNGTRVPLNLTWIALRGTDGGAHHLLWYLDRAPGSCVPAPERPPVELALARLLVDGCEGMLLVLDPTRRISFANESARRWAPGDTEIIGLRLDELEIPIEVVERIGRGVERALERDVRSQFLLGTSRARRLLVRVAPARPGPGPGRVAIVVMLDVTEALDEVLVADDSLRALRQRFDYLGERLDAIASEVRRAELVLDAPEVSGQRLREGITRLSAREREVFDLAVRGLRAPTIARRLHLSPSTVRNHLSAVFLKLGVATQAQLMELVNLPRDGQVPELADQDDDDADRAGPP